MEDRQEIYIRKSLPQIPIEVSPFMNRAKLLSKKSYLAVQVKLSAIPDISEAEAIISRDLRSLNLSEKEIDKELEKARITDGFHVTICYGGFLRPFEECLSFCEAYLDRNPIDDLVADEYLVIQFYYPNKSEIVAMIRLKSKKLLALRQKLKSEGYIGEDSVMHQAHITLMKY